jgi:UDP-N-acetylglucosamine--N-acetylmuramyl-(pentapeptide) pyrophosphoryl-undecaprenol N-acetylglucosamine transferase
MNVVVTGGGTAGHVFPVLAVAFALRDRHDAAITFIGGQEGHEERLVTEAGLPFVGLDVAPAQTRHPFALARAGVHALQGARACRSLVAAADAVVSVGGFASAPAALAARWVRTPLVLIVPDAVPGLVNRIAARWARVVAVQFGSAATRLPRRARIERTGNPIRPDIADVWAYRQRLRVEAARTFGLETGRTTVLIVGGSQGALALDRLVAAAVPALASRDDLQLLVAAGPRHVDVVPTDPTTVGRLRVRVEPFIDRMDLALALADLAVARAGASVAELAACGVPAILVPYPYATENHQEANARELVAAGAATMRLERELSPAGLADAILGHVDDPAKRARMSDAARAWARPDAADRIAALVIEAARAIR